MPRAIWGGVVAAATETGRFWSRVAIIGVGHPLTTPDHLEGSRR